MKSRNKKMTTSLPRHYVYLFFMLLCFEISGSGKFFVAVKMAVVYGECGRECLSGHGNTGSLTSRQNWWGSVVRLMSAVATRAATQ
jgi:hypothetical protein